jgi:hypothetical protein
MSALQLELDLDLDTEIHRVLTAAGSYLYHYAISHDLQRVTVACSTTGRVKRLPYFQRSNKAAIDQAGMLLAGGK